MINKYLKTAAQTALIKNEQIVVMSRPNLLRNQCDFPFLEESFERAGMLCDGLCHNWQVFRSKSLHIANMVGFTVTGDETHLIRRQ